MRSLSIDGEDFAEGAGGGLAESGGEQGAFVATANGVFDLVFKPACFLLSEGGIVGFEAARVAFAFVLELEVVGSFFVARLCGSHLAAVICAFEEAVVVGTAWMEFGFVHTQLFCGLSAFEMNTRRFSPVTVMKSRLTRSSRKISSFMASV